MVDDLGARLAWQPVVAVRGKVAAVAFIVDDAVASDVVTVVDADGIVATCVFDPASKFWVADLPVAGSITSGELSFRVQLESPMGLRSSQVISIPVAPASEVEVSSLEVTPQRVATFPWGDGPGQIGFVGPEAGGEPIIPTAIAFDPVTGNFLILDAANRRVVFASDAGPLGEVGLPGEGFVMDMIVNGSSGTATVTSFSIGAATTTPILVDTAARQARQLATVSIPPAPINAPLVWNDVDKTAYVYVDNAYYPYVNVETGEVLAGRSPTRMLQTRVSDDNRITIGSDDNTVSVELGGTAGGLSPLLHDAAGRIWFVSASIDFDAPPETMTTWSLVRLDLHTSTAVVVPLPGGSPSVIHGLALESGGSALVMQQSAEGVSVDRYTLPT